MSSTTPLNYESKAGPSRQRDDLAYIAPMAIFLLLTWVGGKWQAFFVTSYVLKTIVAAGALIYFRKHYTRIGWSYWWLGVLVGVIGVVQWVGMEKLILHYFPNYPRANVGEPLDPHQYFSTAWGLWSFILIRWMGATLVVPLMEELFWRDYLWRTILAPNDFKLARVGEFGWMPILIVTAFFASVHVQWITAAVWGLMIAGLLVYTKSLGACIVAHGVTNFLLGGWVQWTREWFWW